MKILIIPSWYPHPADPLAGRFFIEQANALAKFSSDEYHILNFGQNAFQISLRRPLNSFRHALSRTVAKTEFRYLRPNLQELIIPHLSWTSRILAGNMNSFPIKALPHYDLVYALVTFPGGYLAQRIAQLQGIPYLVSEHSGPFPLADIKRRNALNSLALDTLLKADALVAISSIVQKQILAYTGRTAQLIPNMVDTDYFVPKSTKSHTIRLFSMSRFTGPKGVEDLAKALILLGESGFDFQMLWAGEGKLKDSIMRMCSPISRKIHFTRFLSRGEALRAYQNCDIYLMPSRVESFSMVLIEAMSCGKPVVATDCGGPKDIVCEGAGILTKVQDPQDFANAIITAANNLNAFSETGIRNYCIQNFGEEAVCKRLTHAFAQLIESGH